MSRVNRRIRLLSGILVSAGILVVTSPSAVAQCGAGVRVFATIGGGTSTSKVRILPGSSRNGTTGTVGSEIGRFWQSNDSTLGNNFTPSDPDKKMDPLRCPTTGNGQAGGGWWQIAQTTKRGLSGAIGAVGCLASTCPFGDLSVVVEDYGSAGAPGINGTAHFIAFRVDETPADLRYWDFAKVAPPETDLLFIEFPVPTITSSFKQGTDRVVTMNYANVSFHAHGQTVAGPMSSTQIVATYDLMVHTGDSDPGRLRSAATCAAPNPGGRCWTLIHQTPFTGVGPSGVTAVVPCESVTKDSFIALGVSFKGGTANVPSALVGRAVEIECDPNLADPPRPKPRPISREARVERAPLRTLGTR